MGGVNYVGKYGPGYIAAPPKSGKQGGGGRDPFDFYTGSLVNTKPVKYTPRTKFNTTGANLDRKAAGETFNRGDRTSGDYRGAVGSDVNDEINRIRSRYSGGGGGDGGAGAAVKKALEFLKDVKGNRSAIAGTYEGYDEITGVYSKEAIASAAEVYDNSEEYFKTAGVDRADFINETYQGAEDTVSKFAELIGSGRPAEAAAQAEITGREFELEAAEAETNETLALIQLEEVMREKDAFASQARDEGQIDRRAVETDVAFKQQQEAAEEQLANARRAAAAAAARRRASIAARNAAISSARKTGQYDEVAAGQYSAVSFLNQNGGDMARDRGEWITAKTFNAIENFVPANPKTIKKHFEGQGMSEKELYLISGGVDAYYDGRDSELANQGRGSGYSGR